MSTRTQQLRAKQRDRGRRAARPSAIPWRGWKDIGYRLFVGFNENRVLLTAAGATYFLLFALVPSLSLFVTLYGLLNDPAGVVDQLSLLDGLVPAGGLDVIREQLVRLTSQTDGGLGLALVISLAVALWGASAGIKALFEAMNVVYGEAEKRNIIAINLLALLFVFGALALLILVLTVVLIVPVVLQTLALGGYGWLVRVGSYGVMMLSLIIALSAIYRWGPSRAEARWRWITPGSLFATFGIVAMSAGFSWYAANFSNYNATYGSLGALIGLLSWIWLSVTIVILGAALNSEIEHQTTVDSTTGAPRPMGARGAYVADTVGGRWPAKGGEAAKGRPASEEAVKR
jgi:membrane protein